jgi:hypothetical protein
MEIEENGSQNSSLGEELHQISPKNLEAIQLENDNNCESDQPEKDTEATIKEDVEIKYQEGLESPKKQQNSNNEEEGLEVNNGVDMLMGPIESPRPASMKKLNGAREEDDELHEIEDSKETEEGENDIKELTEANLEEERYKVDLQKEQFSEESLDIAYYILYILAQRFNNQVFDESEGSEYEEEESEDEHVENITVTHVHEIGYPKKPKRPSFIQKKRDISDPRTMLRNFERNDHDSIRAVKIDMLEVRIFNHKYSNLRI